MWGVEWGSLHISLQSGSAFQVAGVDQVMSTPIASAIVGLFEVAKIFVEPAVSGYNKVHISVHSVSCTCMQINAFNESMGSCVACQLFPTPDSDCVQCDSSCA